MIRTGDRLGILRRTITSVDMMAYGAATWDWNQLHFDHQYATRAGLPAPVVDGQLFGALLVQLTHRALGAEAFVHELAFDYQNMMYAGESVECDGEVTGVRATDLGTRVELSYRILIEESGFGPRRAAITSGRGLIGLSER